MLHQQKYEYKSMGFFKFKIEFLQKFLAINMRNMIGDKNLPIKKFKIHFNNYFCWTKRDKYLLKIYKNLC